jgi:hypothetical protein
LHDNDRWISVISFSQTLSAGSPRIHKRGHAYLRCGDAS